MVKVLLTSVSGQGGGGGPYGPIVYNVNKRQQNMIIWYRQVSVPTPEPHRAIELVLRKMKFEHL